MTGGEIDFPGIREPEQVEETFAAPAEVIQWRKKTDVSSQGRAVLVCFVACQDVGIFRVQVVRALDSVNRERHQFTLADQTGQQGMAFDGWAASPAESWIARVENAKRAEILGQQGSIGLLCGPLAIVFENVARDAAFGQIKVPFGANSAGHADHPAVAQEIKHVRRGFGAGRLVVPISAHPTLRLKLPRRQRSISFQAGAHDVCHLLIPAEFGLQTGGHPGSNAFEYRIVLHWQDASRIGFVFEHFSGCQQIFQDCAMVARHSGGQYQMMIAFHRRDRIQLHRFQYPNRRQHLFRGGELLVSHEGGRQQLPVEQQASYGLRTGRYR